MVEYYCCSVNGINDGTKVVAFLVSLIIHCFILFSISMSCEWMSENDLFHSLFSIKPEHRTYLLYTCN